MYRRLTASSVLWLAATAIFARDVAGDRLIAEPIGNGLSCAEPMAGSAGASGTGAGVDGLDSGDEALGEQRTLITLVSFLDDPSTPFSTSAVELEILDTSNPVSAASYVQEVSYGRAWLAGDVLGWFTMPWNDNPDCLLAYEGQTQPIVDELDPMVDFSQYDRWLIFIPPDAGCPRRST